MATTPVQTTLTALELARAGRFAEIRDLFAPQLQAMVPPEALKSAWEAELHRQGAVSSVGAPVGEPVHAGVVVVKVPVRCERGGFALVASVSEQGQLGGLQLAPPGAAEPITAGCSSRSLIAAAASGGTACFCSATASAARSPRASRPPIRWSPGWSSSRAARSRFIG